MSAGLNRSLLQRAPAQCPTATSPKIGDRVFLLGNDLITYLIAVVDESQQTVTITSAESPASCTQPCPGTNCITLGRTLLAVIAATAPGQIPGYATSIALFQSDNELHSPNRDGSERERFQVWLARQHCPECGASINARAAAVR